MRWLVAVLLVGCADDPGGELFVVDQNSVTHSGEVPGLGPQCDHYRDEKIQITMDPACAQGLPACCAAARDANWFCGVLDPTYTGGFHTVDADLWVSEGTEERWVTASSTENWSWKTELRFDGDDTVAYSRVVHAGGALGTGDCTLGFTAHRE